MNLLKRLTGYSFLLQYNNILVVKWAYHWPVCEICYRLVAWLLVWCKNINQWFGHTFNTGTVYSEHWAYGMFYFGSNWIWKCLLDPVTPCCFVCGPLNGNDGNCFVLQNHLTPFWSTSESSLTWYSLYFQFFYLTAFLFALINNSIFAWCIRQVFLEL